MSKKCGIAPHAGNGQYYHHIILDYTTSSCHLVIFKGYTQLRPAKYSSWVTSLVLWSITRFKEFNKMNFKLNLELKNIQILARICKSYLCENKQ